MVPVVVPSPTHCNCMSRLCDQRNKEIVHLHTICNCVYHHFCSSVDGKQNKAAHKAQLWGWKIQRSPLKGSAFHPAWQGWTLTTTSERVASVPPTKKLRVHHAPLLVGMPCVPMRWPSNSGLVLHYTTSDAEAVHKHSVFTVIFFTCAATSFPHSAKWRIWCTTLDTRSYRYKLWISFPGPCLLTCVHSNHCSACWN
jgi:hypothetical protein